MLAQPCPGRFPIVVGQLAGSLCGFREGLGFRCRRFYPRRGLRLGRLRDIFSGRTGGGAFQSGDALAKNRELVVDAVAPAFAPDPQGRERTAENGAEDDEQDDFHDCILYGGMSRPTAAAVRAAMKTVENQEIAAHSSRFFKTGPGEYGEGDLFYGIRVPVVRKLVREYSDLPDRAVVSLLRSSMHEERLFAVLVLVQRYDTARDESERESVYRLYVDNLDCVNNWDIVDGSAHKIIGPWLEKRDRSFLYDLAASHDLWRRRVAVMSTLHFIKQRDYEDTFAIAEILLHDDEDLIHKAVGWMLREVGNRDRAAEEDFLAAQYRAMPRTMLRYAIERFPEERRQAYLKGEV